MLPVFLNLSNQPAREGGGERKGRVGAAAGTRSNPEMLHLLEEGHLLATPAFPAGTVR